MLIPGTNEHSKSLTAFDAKYVAQHSDLDFGPNIQIHNTIIFKEIPKARKLGKITLIKKFATSSSSIVNGKLVPVKFV